MIFQRSTTTTKHREQEDTGNVGSGGGFEAGKTSITVDFTTNNKRSPDRAGSGDERGKHTESKENHKSRHGFDFFEKIREMGKEGEN